MNFIDKTLTGAIKVFRRVFFSEVYAQKPGLMQQIDPRVKLASIIAFIVSLSAIKQIELVLAAYILMLFLAYSSRIEISFFVKRVWFFIPLFTGVIAIPAIFNLVTPGKAVIILFELPKAYRFGPWSIPKLVTVTEPGLRGATLLTLRVATSVSAALLLALTTKWHDLLRSLRVFYLPEIFVTLLGMAYRYLFLFLKTVEEMHLAKKSRSIARVNSRDSRAWVASRVATLFKKSLWFSESVHSAMLARGFTGEPKSLSQFAIKRIDLAWLSGTIFVCGSLILLAIRA